MRELIQHLMEADIFKPATEDEVKTRRDAGRAEIEQKLGRKIDICPHCNADLRDGDVGAYADETQYHTVSLYWDSRYNNWEYGDSEYNDGDTTGYHCGKCNGDLDRGTDFDVELPRPEGQ